MEKFDPNILCKHASIIVFVGSVIEDIISYLKAQRVIVMTKNDSFYPKHIHPLYIYNEYRPDKIRNILLVQEKSKENILIILDDICEITKDPIIKQLFLNSRRLNITIIISFQYPVVLPRFIIVDFLFVENIPKEYILKLYNSFFIYLLKYEDFRMEYEKEGYLVYDKISGIFRHYPEERDYKIGSDEQWIELNSKMKHV